jgi:tetratricopeptide (TPR) repeat protein
MTTKKKAPMPAAKPMEALSAGKALSAAKGSEAMPPEPPTPSARQLKTFEEGVRLFSLRMFSEACDLFREVAKGPAAHIADKARSYLQICERKLARRDVEFRTAEEHFNYGLERLNSRDIEQARFHFSRALRLEPDADYILYTLALCCGLAGDGNAACENLKRAIELEPRNRILARQDPEFTALAARVPGLRALLGMDAAESR